MPLSRDFAIGLEELMAAGWFATMVNATSGAHAGFVDAKQFRFEVAPWESAVVNNIVDAFRWNVVL